MDRSTLQDIDTMERTAGALFNQLRADNNLPQLHVRDDLVWLARERAQAQYGRADGDRLTHEGGINAEVLAWIPFDRGEQAALVAYDALAASPPHRALILNDTLAWMAIGVVRIDTGIVFAGLFGVGEIHDSGAAYRLGDFPIRCGGTLVA